MRTLYGFSSEYFYGTAPALMDLFPEGEITPGAVAIYSSPGAP